MENNKGHKESLLPGLTEFLYKRGAQENKTESSKTNVKNLSDPPVPPGRSSSPTPKLGKSLRDALNKITDMTPEEVEEEKRRLKNDPRAKRPTLLKSPVNFFGSLLGGKKIHATIPNKNKNLIYSASTSSIPDKADRTLGMTAVIDSSDSEKSSAKRKSELDTKELLKRNTALVTVIRNRLASGRGSRFYYLTAPGLIRIFEIVLSVIHIAAFGFHCTFYEDTVESVIPPFFVGNTREQFFFLANYHSLIGCITIFLTGIFSNFSNSAFICSLYPSVFDFIQFNTIVASSIALIHFYLRNMGEISFTGGSGSIVKLAMAVSGVILALLHGISTVYDVVFFLKRISADLREKEEQERPIQ